MVNPWKVAIADRAFEEATGYKIEWKRFDHGAQVIDALEQKRVDIAVAGSSPISEGISRGLKIELFYIVEDINNAEMLVVRDGSGIYAPQNLKRKIIAVPFKSTSHFHLLFALQQFGISRHAVIIRDLRPRDIEAEWKRGNIDATFIWNPVLLEVLRTGTPLISSGTLTRWGKATFDGMVVRRDWSKDHPDFMTAFVKTMAAADEAYRANPKAWTATSSQVKKIVRLVGGDAKYVHRMLQLYKFPTLEEQASPNWLGGGSKGGAAHALYQNSKFLIEQGVIERLLYSYGPYVNDKWVKTVLDQGD